MEKYHWDYCRSSSCFEEGPWKVLNFINVSRDGGDTNETTVEASWRPLVCWVSKRSGGGGTRLRISQTSMGRFGGGKLHYEVLRRRPAGRLKEMWSESLEIFQGLTKREVRRLLSFTYRCRKESHGRRGVRSVDIIPPLGASKAGARPSAKTSLRPVQANSKTISYSPINSSLPMTHTRCPERAVRDFEWLGEAAFLHPKLATGNGAVNANPSSLQGGGTPVCLLVPHAVVLSGKL